MKYFIFIVFFISGCASIVSEKLYPVTISSAPEGATFQIFNEDGLKVFNGTTPAMVVLPAHNGYFDGETYTIKFKKKGFYQQTTVLDSKIDGWYFGNLWLGGIIGLLIIDPATGAMWKLPDYHNISLTKTDQEDLSSNNKKELRILTINQIPRQHRNKLIPIAMM